MTNPQIIRNIQGTNVPALGFGTWQIDGRACQEAVEAALAEGYRHIDTAQVYENEAQVGAGLEAAGVPRGEVFLTTKVWMSQLTPEKVRSSTAESLEKLRTDYVDLLLIHWPNRDVPLEQSLEAMFRLKQEGRTKHVGVSNFPSALVERALNVDRIFCNQVEYHPFLSQEKLCAQAVEHDFLLTAYSPLARGKVLKNESLQKIGERHHKSAAQVTLRWLLQQDNVAVIPKASNDKHRRSNFDVFDFELSSADMQALHNQARGQRLIDPGWAPEWD